MPSLDYTSQVVGHLYAMVTLSIARSRADAIVASDLRVKAYEYCTQAAHIHEVLYAVSPSHKRFTLVDCTC